MDHGAGRSGHAWRVAVAIARLTLAGPCAVGRDFSRSREPIRQRGTRELVSFYCAWTSGRAKRGVAAVALKGVALHALGVYQAGERPMADVDLLVRPADAQRTARCCNRSVMRNPSRHGRKACSPMLMNKNPPFSASIRITASRSNSMCGFARGSRCELRIYRNTYFRHYPQPGLNAYPSKASLMIHLLLHAAGTMTSQSLRLLHLYDLARLSSQMTEVDWEDSARGRSDMGSGRGGPFLR